MKKVLMSLSEKTEKKFYFPNTELGVDLKLLTNQPGRLGIGEHLGGIISRDGEDHFTFMENNRDEKLSRWARRNPHEYEGIYINVNRSRATGALYPTFNRPRLSKKFTFQDFCRGAADELLMVARFLGEGN